MNLQGTMINFSDVLDAQKAHCRDFLLRDVNSIQKTADELLDYAKNPSSDNTVISRAKLLADTLLLKEQLDRLMPAIECYTKNMITIERERHKVKDLHTKE